MMAIVGVISFFGFIVGIVRTIISVIRKRPVKPIGTVACLLVFIVCMSVTPSVENNNSIESNKPTELEMIITSTEEPVESEIVFIDEEAKHEEIKPAIVYDKLQNLFLMLSFDTTEDNLIKWIKDNGLEYVAQQYNGSPKHITYKIAYKHDVALHRHAESGDYIEASFSKEDGSFMYAEYFNSNAFKTVLLYNYGTYWDLREDKGNNKYSGYYYYKPGESEGGVTIEYSNGRSTETGYHNADTGEYALACILD